MLRLNKLRKKVLKTIQLNLAGFKITLSKKSAQTIKKTFLKFFNSYRIKDISKLFNSIRVKELSNHLISLRLNDVFNSFELKTSDGVRKSKGVESKLKPIS